MLGGQACEASEKFIRLFYDTLDKRRHVRMILLSGQMVNSSDIFMIIECPCLQLFGKFIKISRPFTFNGKFMFWIGRLRSLQ